MSLVAALDTFVKVHLDSLPITVRKNMVGTFSAKSYRLHVVLPGRFQEEIRKLDIQAQLLTHQVQKRMRQLTARNLSTAKGQEQRRKLYDSLKLDFSKLRELSDQKIHLAEKTYETVDKCIIQLDADTAKFNANVRKKLAAQASIAAATQPQQPGPSTSAAVGKKRKGSAKAEEPVKGRKKGSVATAAKKGAAAKDGKAANNIYGVPVTSPVPPLQDMPVDPNEPRYCSCNQVWADE